MSINLKKGNSLNLTKSEPSLKKAFIGLGWEPSTLGLDLDASVFMLGKNGKLVNEQSLIFYNNRSSPDGSITHTGDNRTGAGDGDDEMIGFAMQKVDPSVKEMIICVTIHEAVQRNHNFGMLNQAYIRLVDAEQNNKEILRYDLDEQNSEDTEVIFGSITRDDNNDWHFHAVGLGSKVSFQGIVDKYL